MQQLIPCLSVAISALWSNRIFGLLTCWRLFMNSLSHRGQALSETFFKCCLVLCVCREIISDMRSIWFLVMIEVTTWFILPCLRHAVRTDVKWAPTKNKMDTSGCELSGAGWVWIRETLFGTVCCCRGVNLFAPGNFVIKMSIYSPSTWL